MRRSTRILTALALSLSVIGTGCIGQFALTKEVRKFNVKQSEDRWGRQIWFVLLYVIPVYPFAGFADLIIFNSIEFWQGTNPVNGERSVTPIGDNRTFQSDDGTVLSMALRDDGSIDVRAVDAAGQRYFVNLVRTPQGVAARDSANSIIGLAPRAESRDIAMTGVDSRH